MKHLIKAGIFILIIVTYCRLSSVQVMSQGLEVVLTGSDTLGCNCGGTLTAVVTNGSSSYSYTWNTGATDDSVSGICAGTYTVTVVDNILQDTGIATVFLPDTCLTLTIVINDSVTAWNCNGVATVYSDGGTPPYSYIWSNGETTQVTDYLCPGNYCITVADQDSHQTVLCFEIVEFVDTGCSASYSWLPAGTPSCYETCYEFIDLSEGIDYEMMWSFGDSVFATSSNPQFSFTEYGEHVVCLTIMTATCLDSSCQSINVDSCHLTLNAAVNEVTFYGACNGSIYLDPENATPPFSFLWASGATTQNLTGLCAGNYCATATDAFACKDSVCIHLVNPPDTSCAAEFSWTRIGLTQFIFHGINAQGDVNSWHWDFGDDTYSASQNPTHIYAGLGIYTVCLAIETSTGCMDTMCEIINIDSCNITLNTNIQHPDCYNSCNGQAVLMPGNGEGPYTYSWIQPGNQSQNNFYDSLCAGTYQVTVTDAVYCTLISAVTVTQPDTLLTAASAGQVSCHDVCDGSIILTTTGGTPPYYYHLILQ
ncbi:MAG: hypothetical protein KJ607_03635, partial [Bacteroidetes bacterium]|nr:hypothetical protein [Bacteroidota bacterium]